MIIAIEGGDQAGKRTQTRMLENTLKKRGIPVKSFSFPDYATPVGRAIRRHLAGRKSYRPQVIHCLMSANRWEKLPEIERAQKKYPVIIMNRYYHSNLVYGIANGLKPAWLEKLDWGLPRADLVIVLDVSQKTSFIRKKTNRDKFEKDKSFSQKVSKTYRLVAKKRRWRLVDASRPQDEVHADIMKILAGRSGIRV